MNLRSSLSPDPLKEDRKNNPGILKQFTYFTFKQNRGITIAVKRNTALKVYCHGPGERSDEASRPLAKKNGACPTDNQKYVIA
jgi:hypothetical protein